MRRASSNIFRIAAILLILVLFSTCIVTGRLARYVSSTQGMDSARVARFELTQSGVQEDVFYTHIQPGQVTLHTITVQNKSEVAMRYRVQMVNVTQNLPGLCFQLARWENGEDSTELFEEATNTFSEELAPGSSEVTIVIRTVWDNTDPANIEKVDYVKMIVTAEQID